MKEKILEVENLSKQYIVRKNLYTKSKIDAVDDISFFVRSEESLGLIGESGCGKTTTANMILRLIEPDAGTIRFCGKLLSDLDEKRMRDLRKDIQIIFQHSNVVLDPKMSIEELLTEPLRIHKIVTRSEERDEVSRLLGMVGIAASERHKFTDQLSGGQIQRIIIARAIATRPKMIVCDEPMSALDVSVQCQIINLLTKLKKELKLTYLFISHDIKVVRLLCERIAVMYRGEIVEFGDTEEVLEHPRHSHTKRLIAAQLGLSDFERENLDR